VRIVESELSVKIGMLAVGWRAGELAKGSPTYTKFLVTILLLKFSDIMAGTLVVGSALARCRRVVVVAGAYR
jgi:hypothetical protein